MDVAVVANTGLGDGLWMMVIANNFARHGHRVTLYSSFLCHLKGVFPQVTIEPYSDTWEGLLASYDRVLIQQYTPLSKQKDLPKHAYILRKEELDLSRSYVLNLQNLCKEQFDLHLSGTDVGAQLPKDWVYRANLHRVVIHPSSANAWKNWPVDKFIRLAKRLQDRGYTPCFTLPPKEVEEWRIMLAKAQLPDPLCVGWMDLAQFIYESGYLIGNDASAGHLASALHIPTLSIFDRDSRAVFWRPGWGPGKVVLPYPVLPGRSLRKAYWKQFLSVGRAYRAFDELSRT